MNEQERRLIEQAALTAERLLLGELPGEIDIAKDCSQEVRRVCEAVNRLVSALRESHHFIISLSEGKLEVEAPPRNFLISAFKQLHSNMRHLTWQVQQIARGDLEQRVDFLGEFSASFNTMITSLREKKEIEGALKRTNELLEHQATTDALTGIANRLKFNNAMAVEVSKARRHVVPLSLIMFDIDNFKLINDTFGHRAGDKALQSLASLVSAAMRPEDIFARWGGEEFVILLPYTDAGGAVNLAERLRHKIEMYPFSAVNSLTCSFGVVRFHAAESEDMFVGRADRALYEAKRQGKNTVITAED